LAAGYVIAVITYRSRDDDPQSRVSFEDTLAAVDYVRHLGYVDPKSIFVYGASGGGDLAFEVAAAADLSAIATEEPATVLLTGVFNKTFAKNGERYTPGDADPIGTNPKLYYTSEFQKITQEKIARIRCPILIVQGDQHWINRFNREVFIPELQLANKVVEIKTYPGEQHGFAFRGSGDTALKAFLDIEAFFRRYAKTQPQPLNANLVRYIQ
jgi:dienelactone hydrolase